MAPMACTPPALKIWLTPAMRAATRTAGLTLPSLLGGVQSTISRQPAILAGVASMSTVLNNGAVPPGIYKPTLSMATLFCQQVTPGWVLTLLPTKRSDSWKVRMLSWANRMADFRSSSTRRSASSISASLTANEERRAWSNFSSYSFTASSPRDFTSSRTPRTVAVSCETSR